MAQVGRLTPNGERFEGYIPLLKTARFKYYGMPNPKMFLE